MASYNHSSIDRWLRMNSTQKRDITQMVDCTRGIPKEWVPIKNTRGEMLCILAGIRLKRGWGHNHGKYPSVYPDPLAPFDWKKQLRVWLRTEAGGKFLAARRDALRRKADILCWHHPAQNIANPTLRADTEYIPDAEAGIAFMDALASKQNKSTPIPLQIRPFGSIGTYTLFYPGLGTLFRFLVSKVAKRT